MKPLIWTALTLAAAVAAWKALQFLWWVILWTGFGLYPPGKLSVIYPEVYVEVVSAAMVVGYIALLLGTVMGVAWLVRRSLAAALGVGHE